MNKTGDTSVLETIIGALIGIAVAAITFATIFFVINIGNPGQDSLQALAKKVIEVSKGGPGATGSVSFYQEEDSFFYPITTETRNQPFQRKGSKLFSNDLDFVLSHTNPNCETETCLCLCEEFDQEVTKRCVQGKLFCEQLPGVSLSTGTTLLVTRLEEGGIGVYDLGSLATGTVPIIGKPVSAAIDVIQALVVEDPLPAPATQSVKIIKCRGIENEPYCKKSKPGDISIIFNWLDQKGVYQAIK